MTSTKFSCFWTPSPPCPNFALTYSIEFTQPPLLHLLLAQPPSPPQCGRHMYVAPYPGVIAGAGRSAVVVSVSGAAQRDGGGDSSWK